MAKSHAKTAAGATIGPEAMYWAPKFVQSLWNAKRDLHYRERMLCCGRARRRWQRLRHRPRHVPARVPDSPAAGQPMTVSRSRGIRMERPGQPGMDQGLRQPLRHRVRRLRHAEAHAKDQRLVLQRSRWPERHYLTGPPRPAPGQAQVEGRRVDGCGLRCSLTGPPFDGRWRRVRTMLTEPNRPHSEFARHRTRGGPLPSVLQVPVSGTRSAMIIAPSDQRPISCALMGGDW